MQEVLNLQLSDWAATLICPIITFSSLETRPSCWRSPACSRWRPSPRPATQRRWPWSVRSLTAPGPLPSWNCPKSHCHYTPPTSSSSQVREASSHCPLSLDRPVHLEWEGSSIKSIKGRVKWESNSQLETVWAVGV